MAFTKLYLTNRTAPYTPATLRGAWDDTAGAVTRALDPQKTSDGGTATTVARAETNVSTTFDVLLYRGVSGPLAAQTLSGTVNITAMTLESNSAADFYWHVHLYVTQGDSDTPRGTILTDYVENTTNEWPTTITGINLQSAQSLSSLAISAGDRLVAEIGFIARNNVTTSRTGTLGYGVVGSTLLNILDDQATNTTVGAPFLTFSNSITEDSITSRVSQEAIETLSLPTPDARVSQLAIETLVAASPNAVVSQMVVETLTVGVPVAYVSQVAIEVLTEIAPNTVYRRTLSVHGTRTGSRQTQCS